MHREKKSYSLKYKILLPVSSLVMILAFSGAYFSSYNSSFAEPAVQEAIIQDISQVVQEVEFQFFRPEGHEGPLTPFINAPDTRVLGKGKTQGDRILVRASEKFSLTVEWYVEGHGYFYLTADRDQDYYDPKEFSGKPLNLNFELAESRRKRNDRVLAMYQEKGFKPSAKLISLIEQNRALHEAARKSVGEAKARKSDKVLSHAMEFGHNLELEWANYMQNQPGFKPPLIGVDSRHYFWSNVKNLNERLPELFDYATITHYLVDEWFPPFEPNEGDLRWGAKEDIYQWLNGHGLVVQARPVLWFQEDVTPDWLKKKSFEELKVYAQKHAESLVKYWGDRITRWEVANEMHDWANVHQLTASQITELIKLTCDTIRKLQPNATLIINNTDIFGNYAGMMEPSESGTHPRTPYQFIEDLVEAKVDFDVIGLQIYDPLRDLSDIVRLIERFEGFGKKIIISEMGVPSYYEHEEELINNETSWTETAQADWAEDMFRVLGVRSSIDVIAWYDLTDFRSFVHNGGVLTDDGLEKEVFTSLMMLKKEWYSKK